MKADDVDRFII